MTTIADLVARSDVVDAAIAKVLDAEHAAGDAVRAAGDAATAMTEQARAVARALAERTEQRIRAARAAFETHTSDEVALLDAEADATRHDRALTPAEIARVDAAVAALAARLTGSAV